MKHEAGFSPRDEGNTSDVLFTPLRHLDKFDLSSRTKVANNKNTLRFDLFQHERDTQSRAEGGGGEKGGGRGQPVSPSRPSVPN